MNLCRANEQCSRAAAARRRAGALVALSVHACVMIDLLFARVRVCVWCGAGCIRLEAYVRDGIDRQG